MTKHSRFAAILSAAVLSFASIPQAGAKQTVEVAFVLDTTGSMGPLIEGAKQKIWAICNQVASGQPTPDLTALFDTIAKSGQNERSLINQLPDSLKPLYDQYKTSLGTAGTTLQTTTQGIGQTLQDKTAALYGPTSPAVTATLAALKQQDYSTQPGTLEALKSQLAATGGLSRGGAATALTKAVLAPAAQYSQQAANVTGAQLTAQQQAQQAAINKVAAMDDQTAQAMFGMSKEEATNILTSGRQDLQQQLIQLINQSNIQTNQTLNAEGIQTNAGYQNAVANNAQQQAIVNGLVNTGAGVVNALAAPGTPATASGYPGMNTTSPDYMQNALLNAPPGLRASLTK